MPGEHERLHVGVSELVQVANVVADRLLDGGVEVFGPASPNTPSAGCAGQCWVGEGELRPIGQRSGLARCDQLRSDAAC